MRTSSTKYLFAKCAVDLEKDFEAETVLNGSLGDPRIEVTFFSVLGMWANRWEVNLKIIIGKHLLNEPQKSPYKNTVIIIYLDLLCRRDLDMF